MTLDQIAQYAFQTALEAERLWVGELKTVYGKNYVDARYDHLKNRNTPALEMLYNNFVYACQFSHRASRIASDAKRQAA